MSNSAHKPALLWLFPQEWESVALPKLKAEFPDVDFVDDGFDLFTFPSNAKLLWFDPQTFVKESIARHQSRGIAGVASTHEQFGALSAALLGERLGLAATPVNAVLTAQHKLLAREAHQKVAPEAVPPFEAIHYTADVSKAVTIGYPLFVKPIKAAFSILAKKCPDEATLKSHMKFAPWETVIIKRLTRPFNRLARERLGTTVDGDWMIAEGLMGGEQLNVDGFAFGGEIEPLGVVDSIMYPGTTAFERFQYPSRLPSEVQARAQALAKIALEAIGFSHGMFNVEMFWDRATDSLKIIEVNPRMAGQFADLYEKVDGRNLFAIQTELALGRRPIMPKRKGRYGAAASFVYREFGERVVHEPSRAQQEELKRLEPDSLFFPMVKYGVSRKREQHWLGSYRYGLLHLGGEDADDLMARYARANQVLRFDQPLPGLAGWWFVFKRSF